MRTLTYSLLILVLIATAGLGWLFDHFYDQYTATQQYRNVDKVNVLEQLGTSLAKTLAALPDRHQFVQQWPAEQQYQLAIISVDDFPMPQALLDQIRRGQPLLLESNDTLAIHYYLAASDELLILKSPLFNITQTDQPINYIFTVLFYIALLLLFLLWVYPLIRQLLALRLAARSFGEGDLKQRIQPGSISYIRDIEIEFNHMAQRIEDLIGDVKLLSSAVSHDLRTPLARIRFGIDTLQEEDDPLLRARYQQKISDNVDEMTSLVETLLNYARLDKAMLDINKEHIELTRLVENCINAKTTDSIEIELIQHSGEYRVIADNNYLMMLINNLLQNAVNYGRGKIIVTLTARQDCVTISVEDNGEGIDPAQWQNILKPFVRGAAAKSGTKGHGIGLAIVKRILDWHQGSIEINNSSELSGAQFTVSLPKNL